MLRGGLRRVITHQSRRLSTLQPETAVMWHTGELIGDKRPVIMNDSWVAPTATVAGDVFLADEATVWYSAVVRGAHNKVHIGNISNVQEKALVETVEALDSGFPAITKVGDYVSIGAGAVLRSCTIGDKVSVGIGSVIPEGCVVETNVKLEPGTVLEPDTFVPAGEKWAGNPAAFVAHLTEDETAAIVDEAKAIAVRAAELNLQYVPAPGAP